MQARFSRRTAWDLGESALSEAVRLARASGRALIDLTISNPTLCGFRYDDGTLEALNHPDALRYDPNPLGILAAREAVAHYYADHGAAVDPERILLTTSTSEAYSYLFRLLCDPGTEVLAATPSYPLFDYLATLDDVVLRTFPLFYDFGWWIDFAELERRITAGTRAILLVSPNNPTGHATGSAERQHLEALCARHGLALIVDEVFLDYGLEATVASFAAGEHGCLTFVVSGISKVAALPQMKVGWLLALGPGAEDAMARLEVVADTFLSMNAPAQLALPLWLAKRLGIQDQIVRRVKENLRTLEGASCLEYLPVAAGWSAVAKLPGWVSVAECVSEAGVIVHPGEFYGLAGSKWMVLSLLGPCVDFESGVEKLNRWCESRELTRRGLA